METNDTIIDPRDEHRSKRRRDGLKLAGAAGAASVAGLALATTVATPMLGYLSGNHNETVLD